MNLREFQRNKFKMIKARMMISSQGKPNLAKFYGDISSLGCNFNFLD